VAVTSPRARHHVVAGDEVGVVVPAEACVVLPA